MKNLLVLTIIALVSFSFAANERFYIEDHLLDYSLEDLTDIEGETIIYEFEYNEDLKIEQAKDVKVFTHFDTTKPDNKLRIYLHTMDLFLAKMPPVLVTLPMNSTEIEDISEGIEVVYSSQKITGIKLNVPGALEDIVTLYIKKFEDLDFSVTKPDDDKDTYMISLDKGTYSVDFTPIEDTDVILVTIAGQ